MVSYKILNSRWIKRQLLRLLTEEWRNDPSGPADLALIRGASWTTKALDLRQIELAADVVGDRPFMKRLEKRVNAQITMIRDEIPISPLVVFGKRHLLIDGYARYFALRKLGVCDALTYSGAEKVSSTRRTKP